MVLVRVCVCAKSFMERKPKIHDFPALLKVIQHLVLSQGVVDVLENEGGITAAGEIIEGGLEKLAKDHKLTSNVDRSLDGLGLAHPIVG